VSELIDNRARRIATLKEIIQHLHKGEAPEAVKGKLREMVQQTNPSEIMAMEQELIMLGVQCLESGHLPAREADRFRQAVSDLASIYGEHIRIEDNVVFPAAQQALSRSEKSVIANEMASRRELVS
jgi:DUF438 domain-containing protein